MNAPAGSGIEVVQVVEITRTGATVHEQLELARKDAATWEAVARKSAHQLNVAMQVLNRLQTRSPN